MCFAQDFGGAVPNGKQTINGLFIYSTENSIFTFCCPHYTGVPHIHWVCFWPHTGNYGYEGFLNLQTHTPLRTHFLPLIMCWCDIHYPSIKSLSHAWSKFPCTLPTLLGMASIVFLGKCWHCLVLMVKWKWFQLHLWKSLPKPFLTLAAFWRLSWACNSCCDWRR